MVAAEIELKFRVRDAAELHRRVIAHGFQLITPRTFERNTLYDTPERTLRAQRQLLRIRTYGDSTVLTHKKPSDPEREAEGRFKFRQESETELSDGAALGTIFTELGYAPVFVYEKYRTEFTDGTGKIVIDETPIGTFAEAEGDPEWIDRITEELGVPMTDCFTDSYGRMFELWREETGSAARDMTFNQVGELATSTS